MLALCGFYMTQMAMLTPEMMSSVTVTLYGQQDRPFAWYFNMSNPHSANVLLCAEIFYTNQGCAYRFPVTTRYRYPVYKTRVLRKFPGPKPVPYLGILPDMITKGFHNLDVELTQKYGPVVGTYIGHFPSILIADPDMIKQIYVKEFRSFPNRPELIYMGDILGGSVTLEIDDHWKFLRHILSPSFSPAKLKQTFATVERCTARMISRLKKLSTDGKHVDLEKICHVFALDVICGTAFGIDVNSQDNPDIEIVRMARYMTTATVSGPVLLLQALFPELKTVMRKFKLAFLPKMAIDYFVELTKTVFKERQTINQERSDFLQLLINAYSEKNAKCGNKTSDDSFESYLERGITDRDLYANSLMFIIEGFDTTAVGLLYSVYRLAINEECQEKLIEEIDREIGQQAPDYENISRLKYMDMYFSEVMRMYPPNTRSNREAIEDVTIKGYTIPKGAEVTVPIYAMHYNPEFWQEPEKFNPERFLPEEKGKRHPYCYMPFGHGPRNCIGMRFAQIEIKMALVKILQNFRLRRTSETEDPIEFDSASVGILRPKHPVMVKMETRYT